MVESAVGKVHTKEANAMAIVSDILVSAVFMGLEQSPLDDQTANAMGNEEERTRRALGRSVLEVPMKQQKHVVPVLGF